MKAKILIAEDDDAQRKALVEIIQDADDEYIIEEATDGKEALRKIDTKNYDLILTDMRMDCGVGVPAETCGLEILKQSKKHDQTTEVILLTAHRYTGTMFREAEGYRPYEYLDKSESLKGDFEQRLCDTIKSALEQKGIGNPYLEQIKGRGKAMREVINLTIKSAKAESVVLITGESGTGKELIAKAIHYNSQRRNEPFVPVNCAAIPESLVESELFGHERGAFTGAVARRIGKFEEANNGTLFLDEIGDMRLDVQAKLLRAIQEGEIERVGGTVHIKVDVRILAATNRDLEKAIADERFREDLYYRLNVLHIHIPPLRERKEDIPELVEYLFDKAKQKCNRKNLRISDEAWEILTNYDWPGNVRELGNILEQAVVKADDDEVLSEHLGLPIIRQSSKKTRQTLPPTSFGGDNITGAVLLALHELTKEKEKELSTNEIGDRMLPFLPKEEKIPKPRKIGGILKKLQLYTRRERIRTGYVYDITAKAVQQRMEEFSKKQT